jgi:hypothetical protein
MNPLITGPPRGKGIDFASLTLAGLKRERDRCVASSAAKNPPITRVLPVPRAIPLGGSLRVASELTMGDLARLQAWLEGQTPHPMEGLPPAWADPSPETRPGRLAAAWEAAKSWPVRYGTEAGSILLGSPEGRAYFLSLALRPADPGFGVADALELLARITPTEWAGLRRVAYGITPREELADEIAPDPSPAKTANWCLSLHRATLFDGGPTYESIRDWHVSTWRNFCQEGKASEFLPEHASQSKRVKKALETMNVG